MTPSGVSPVTLIQTLIRGRCSMIGLLVPELRELRERP